MFQYNLKSTYAYVPNIRQMNKLFSEWWNKRLLEEVLQKRPPEL